MGEFTKGPWQADVSFDVDGEDDRANVSAGAGRTFCYVRELEAMQGNMMPRMIADAHLIAAAPDMFEALTEAVATIHFLSEHIHRIETAHKMFTDHDQWDEEPYKGYKTLQEWVDAPWLDCKDGSPAVKKAKAALSKASPQDGDT